jgi:hypothetical protein
MEKSANVDLKHSRPLKLSPRYTEKHWNDAFAGGEDWDTAINIVQDRIKGRWLDSADRLLDEPHSGFAIIALDCIVLESVWGFMNGKAVPHGKEQQVYQELLTGRAFGLSPELSEKFRDLVRNGIMHDAETRNQWLIEKTVPRDTIAQQTENGDYVLNRTKFHGALTAVFDDWVAKLQRGDAALRGKMRDRMNGIINRHYAAA